MSALGSLADAVLPAQILVRRGKSGVALTFDDGPHAMTPAYLDVLDRFGAQATFFVVGDVCAPRRAELLEILRRGHELCSHGFTHTPFPELAPPAIRDELDRTSALLPPPELGRPLVRPPRGAVSLRSLVTCARAGYTTVLWSLDSGDCRTEDAAEIAAALAPDRVADGEIVLLHEGQPWTLAALPDILRRLRDDGRRLCTVSEMLHG